MKNLETKKHSVLWRLVVSTVLFCLFAVPSFSQNTKGDKPSKPLPRVVQKSNKKPSREKAKTKDISGRRLRTKNKSSAVRAIQNTPNRAPSRPSRGDRSVRNDRPVIKSSTAKSARSNVYPQIGPYVNNPSRKPKQKAPTYSNRNIVKQRTKSAARRSQSNVYPQRGPYINNPSATPRSKQPTYSNRGVVQRNVKSSKLRASRNIYSQRNPYVNNPSRTPKKNGQTIFNNRNVVPKGAYLRSRPMPAGSGGGYNSASGNFFTRGRKNVYWGKFRKGERAITTDITGRKLRTRNYRSPVMGLLAAPNPYAFRKKKGERAYQGGFRFGFSSASRSTQRAWTGDISGQPLRRGNVTKPTQTAGKKFFARKLSISGQGKVGKSGGGYQSISGKGGSNAPLQGRSPGVSAVGLGKYLKRTTGRKPVKGGGSVSGQAFNNGNRPINGKSPGIGAVGLGGYQGSYKRGSLKPGFRDQGIGFSGFAKAQKPVRGGGSVSGQARNNRGNPIDVRAPRSNNAGRVGTFQGNIKAQRPQKGGGSISGQSRNNGGNPVDVKAPTSNFAGRVGTFQGNIRAGGKNFRNQGEEFSGSIKAKKIEKGGGSISGRSRNNNGNPVDVRAPRSNAAGLAGTYQGNIKAGGRSFRNQGEEFSGYVKAKKPAKGGGSVSGKLWNNNETPIDVRTPLAEDARAANYSGKVKLKVFKKPYVKNPNAVDLALKQQRPDPTTYRVAGLQVKVKQGKYERNKSSAKESLLVIGQSKTSVRASEYSGKMKVLWDYRKNPSSHELALKSIAGTKAFNRATEDGGKLKVYWKYKQNPSASDLSLKTIAGTKSFYKATTDEGRVRLHRNYRHNPAADPEALKVFAPGRSYARINDFQGNLKMKKIGGKGLHPDAAFAHQYRNNVADERTLSMNFKLIWAKVFRKNNIQTKAVKQKSDRPRYDKKEKELWKDLYD